MLRANFGGGAHIAPRLAGCRLGRSLRRGRAIGELLPLSTMISRARLVRSSFSLGVNRISPLTQRLISRVAISVMRICSPRSVMVMTPAISIASWHSRMDIVGGAGGIGSSGIRDSPWEGVLQDRCGQESRSWPLERKGPAGGPEIQIEAQRGALEGRRRSSTTKHLSI